ncbi:hypothetical protein B0X59_00620 [Helicobacter pylori]|nr:hypothetical protein B0X59_00620 [Helicobacter pylori]PDX04679.1 hypothetical protein BB402_06480 [Helicobacter pylori]
MFWEGGLFWRENLKFSFKVYKNSVKSLITRDDIRSKMVYAEWSLRMFAGSRTHAVSSLRLVAIGIMFDLIKAEE